MYWEDSDSWKIDINIPMMINTLKISSIPFIIYDGSKDDKDLKKDQIKNKLVSKPTYFEYIGYIVFFPSAILGPFFEYKIYYNYIYNLEDFNDVKEIENKSTISEKQIDSLIYPKSKFNIVIQRTIKALVYAVVYALCQKYFDYKMFFELREFRLREFISVLFAFSLMFRYIIGWMFSEAHLALCGISYNKENNDYQGIKLVDDIKVTFFPDPNNIFQVRILIKIFIFI